LITFSYSQKSTLSLEYCYEQAIRSYPLSKQKELLNSKSNLKIANLKKNFLPEINLNSQATYQSEVTEISISMPEITLPTNPPTPINIPDPDTPELPKDQYKLTLDINQLIYDGGLTKK
jgi:hypothetical protein